MRHAFFSTALLSVPLSLAPALAFAHAGHASDSSFFAGLLHPLTGADHMLAMAAIGVIAARFSDWRALGLPLIFIAGMTLGVVAGLAMPASGLIEIAVATSVVVLGLGMMSDRTLPLIPAALAAAGFGFAHGHAHGVELGASGGAGAAVAGILLATASLHGIGLLLGRTLRQSPRLAPMRRGAGGVMAAFGAVLLV